MSNPFIITCHGWSASNWLAYALSRHTGVYCIHNVLFESITTADDSDGKVKESQLCDLIRSRSIDRLKQPIDETLAKIREHCGRSRAYGGVATFRLRDIEPLVSKYGASRKQLVLLNMIRHPISVVWSGYGQLRKRFYYDLYELSWNLSKILKYSYEHFQYIGKKYKIDVGSVDALAFYSSVLTLRSLKMDVDASRSIRRIPHIKFMGHVKMEDLTSSSRELGKLIHIIAPDSPLDESEYKLIYEAGAINQHNMTGFSTEKEKYSHFSDWQKEVFIYHWKENAMKAFYEQEGYDVSFVC